MENNFILTPYFLDDFQADMLDLAGAGWQLNHPDLEKGDRQGRMITLYKGLRDRVSRAVSAGARPVSIAGDCCTTIGFLAGLQAADLKPSLVWFDAHGDFNTWETTPSGFLGGMPLAMLVGRGEQRLVSGAGMRNLEESRVILTDARDLDPGEREALSNSSVLHLEEVSELLERPLPGGPIWVHFDVDVLSTNEMPAVNYPAAGGPSADVLRLVFQHLASTGRIAAVSLSSWDAKLDQDGRSRALSLELLSSLIG